VTLLLPNPAQRFPLACGPDPQTLGLRVPRVDGALAPLAAVRWPLLQSSANLADEPAPCRIDDVPASIRAGVDLVLDAGELPGTPSTVVDLTAYEDTGVWAVVREGAVTQGALTDALDQP
jgi:L-threonylcarbamoyladenylate synthase